MWAGAMHASVYDLKPTGQGDWAWFAAAVTPRLRMRLGAHATFELGGHVIAPIGHSTYTVKTWDHPAFQQSHVALVAFAGLGVRF
jgi:hypothetical protein